jgi:cell division protease FtsH
LIAFLMGGRCAEEIEFNEITNGASNDIERATQLAHSMVCSWGMSTKMGPRNYSRPGASPFGGQGMDSVGYSDTMASEIDAEMNTFIDDNYKLALKILNDNKDALDRLAEGLILWETLDFEQVKALVAGEDIGVPLVEKAAPAPEKKEEVVSETKSEDSKEDSDPVPVS